MGFDEEYLEDLLKSIEPIIYPDGRPEADDVPEMPEEELDSRIAEPQDSPMPEEEEIEEVLEPVAAVDIQMDGDPNKQLSADEIAALFAAADGGSAPAEEPAAEETNVEEIASAPEAEEASGNDELDIMALLGEAGEPESIDTDGLSEEEIDAMLNAAKAGADEVEEIASDDDDLMAMLAEAGDASLDDIQSLLNADETGEAVDEAAFIAATSTPDVADTVLDDEDDKASKKRKKAEAKAAKKAKKKAKKGDNPEGEEGDDITGEPKKGLFGRIIAALTESDEDDEDGAEGEGLSDGEEAIDISDENRDILAELDGEKGKKKAKKPKKDKKKKKGKKGENPEGEDGEDGGEGEEGEGKKKKAKKPKKPKKAKEAKEKEPEKPEKKLPKKRVRRVMFLAFSILAAILVGVFGGATLATMNEARWAFDNQDYETVYEDLYGMKLKGSDQEIFKKSETIMTMERKLTSYQNYTALGMKEEAVAALIDAVKAYPDIRLNASKYGVESQVDYTYSQILSALSGMGLNEADALEIANYDSKVKYTKRIRSIAYGTPFEYEGDGSVTSNEPVEVKPTVDDILPEESDFLPDNPEDIFDVDYSGASEMTPEQIEGLNDTWNEGATLDSDDGREIEAEVEIIDSHN